MPELLEGQQNQTNPAPETPPAQAAGGEVGGGGGTASPPAGTGLEGGGAAAAAPPPSAPAGFREQLRGLGVDLSSLPDDNAALAQVAALYQAAPQLRQLAAVGQQVYPFLSEFQAWREQQARAAQQPAQAPPSWWKAPDYDPRWQTQLTRDPATGQIIPVQGADPAIVQKYHQWMEHRQTFLDKFAQNPIDAIAPGIKELVQGMIQPMLQQTAQQQAEERRAEAIVQQNADWLHERDANGQPVRDQFGNRVLSVWGQRYAGYVQQAQQMGVVSAQQAHQYAMGFVERDFLAAQYRAGQQQAQNVQSGQAAKDNFVNGARHNPNVGSTNAAGVNGAPVKAPAPQNTRDLHALLMQRMGAAGYRGDQPIGTR